MALEHVHQLDLGLVQLPARGDEAAILVAVGIAEHHLLHAAAAIDQPAIVMQAEQPVHDLRGIAQIVDGFEQRHHIDGATPGRIDQPGFLEQHRDLEQIGHALGHRDDALRDHRRAIFGMRLRGDAEHRQLAGGFFAVADERRLQRPRAAQLGGEQRDPRVLIHRHVAGARDRGVDQLGDGALMNGGVLPDVERGEMEAKAIDRAPQPPQPAARDHRAAIGDERMMHHVEVGFELGGVGIRLRLCHRRADVIDAEPLCGGREPRIDAGHRQPIRLGAAMRRGVGRGFGQRAQLIRNAGEIGGNRQFQAKRLQLGEIVPERACALHLHRAAHHLGSDERIAVAVAADPAAHAQERGQLACLAIILREFVFEHAIEPRQLAQKRIVVERQPVADFVKHGELGPPQHVGLPQRQHRAPELLLDVAGFLRRHLQPFAMIDQPRDLHLAVHGALAAHLGRMRGQHRRDQCLIEEFAQLLGAKTRLARMRQRRQHPALLGAVAGPHLADVVLVLGDVGEVREIAEGAHDPHRFRNGQAVQEGGEFVERVAIIVAMKADRLPADALDQIKDLVAFLIAHRVAENAAQQPDVGAQLGIFVSQRDRARGNSLHIRLSRQISGRHGDGSDQLRTDSCSQVLCGHARSHQRCSPRPVRALRQLWSGRRHRFHGRRGAQQAGAQRLGGQGA